MSFVQRGVDMVNERLNRVKGSPEQRPAEFPAEVPLTIEGGRGPAPSLPTSSSIPAAGDAAPDHWRHVHNRIAAGQRPRDYTRERHRAWLKRRELLS